MITNVYKLTGVALSYVLAKELKLSPEIIRLGYEYKVYIPDVTNGNAPVEFSYADPVLFANFVNAYNLDIVHESDGRIIVECSKNWSETHGFAFGYNVFEAVAKCSIGCLRGVDAETHNNAKYIELPDVFSELGAIPYPPEHLPIGLILRP